MLGRFSAWITPKEQRAWGWARFASLQIIQQSLHIQMLHLFSCHSTEHNTSSIISHYKNSNIEFAFLQIIWADEIMLKPYKLDIEVTEKTPENLLYYRCNQSTKNLTRPNLASPSLLVWGKHRLHPSPAEHTGSSTKFMIMFYVLAYIIFSHNSLL